MDSSFAAADLKCSLALRATPSGIFIPFPFVGRLSMQRVTLLMVLLAVMLDGRTRAASPGENWDAPPSGLQPEVRLLHVVSSAERIGGAPKSYMVDSWYFDNEMIIQVRSADSDMLGFEDKTKSQAAYWEKGIDTSTPRFPKISLDEAFTNLAPYANIWFNQQPIRKLMQPQGARTSRDVSASLTTVTLRITPPILSGRTVHLSAVYRDSLIIGFHQAGGSSGQIDDVAIVDYKDHDAQTSLPRLVNYQHLVPPYYSIRHKVTSIEPIPADVSAQSLLRELSEGYRPVTIRMLNDPAGRMGPPAGGFQYWGLRIAAAAAALLFIVYGVRRASRRAR